MLSHACGRAAFIATKRSTFAADLSVDDDGLVIDHPTLFERAPRDG
jgi:hypothetical protein